MIETEALKEMTQEAMQQMREKATMVLINNQEVYVAQWILQNPFLKISDYYLCFKEGEAGELYRVSMERKPDA